MTFQPLDDVRWGIIGSGDVAEHKSGPALYQADHSTLVAVMSRRGEKARDFGRRHGAKRAYDDADALINDPEVNAVYIGTPPHVHDALTARAARAGKHVLCEKPMAVTVAECESMIEVCREHGVQLMIAYYRRFFPVVQKIKALVDDGAVGEPLRVSATVAALYQPRNDGERSWLVDPDVAGGGFLTDVATHRIDLMTHFFGPAREVAAFVDTQTFDFEVDDAASLLMRFDGGVHGVVQANWNVGVGLDDFEISGTRGRLVTRNLSSGGDLDLITADGTVSFHLPAQAVTHLHLVEHFVEALRTGTPNGLDGEAGMQATRITEAAYASAGRGVVVRLD